MSSVYRPVSQFKWEIARLSFYINRFSSLPRAERLFRDVAPGTRLRRTLFGHEFVADVSRAAPQKLLFLIGERYVIEAELIERILKRGMKVVDVGANIGYYMLMFEQIVRENGQIFVIEPSPENLTELELNVKRNKLENVQIIRRAVGNEIKKVGLLGGINSGVTSTEAGPFMVQQDLLDNLITERIDFLKIDIEGYEGQALAGARRVLAEYRPILFLEIHPSWLGRHGWSTAQIMDFLSKYYGTIDMYERKKDLSLYEKCLVYYAEKSEIHRISNADEYITSCQRGEITDPFWAVCSGR
jgi:FkbM family methyltransferase